MTWQFLPPREFLDQLALLPRDSWQVRHNMALWYPEGVEQPILLMMYSLWLYKTNDKYQRQFNQDINEDYVLGRHFREMVDGLRGLLNGNLERLDAATIDRFLWRLAPEQTPHGVRDPIGEPKAVKE